MSQPEKLITFKSQRSVNIMFGKAERAYGETLNTLNGERNKHWEDGRSDEAIEAAQKLSDAAYERLAAVYTAAREQGFWTRTSWWIGYNATRDLVNANID